MPFATLTSLSISFVGYDEDHANFLRMLLWTVLHLRKLHLVWDHTTSDQDHFVELLTSAPLLGLESLSLRDIMMEPELMRKSLGQILATYRSLRTFKSTSGGHYLILHLPRSLESWTYVMPRFYCVSSDEEGLKDWTSELDGLAKLDWPDRANWSLKVLRLEANFYKSLFCHYHVPKSTDKHTSDEWRRSTTLYWDAVSKLEAKFELNGIRLKVGREDATWEKF